MSGKGSFALSEWEGQFYNLSWVAHPEHGWVLICVATQHNSSFAIIFSTQEQILEKTHRFSKIRIKFQQVVQLFLQRSWREGLSLVIL